MKKLSENWSARDNLMLPNDIRPSIRYCGPKADAKQGRLVAARVSGLRTRLRTIWTDLYLPTHRLVEASRLIEASNAISLEVSLFYIKKLITILH